MYKGINEITNKDLGFELTNFMSFDEFVFLAEFNQKTIMGDLKFRGNPRIPQWEQRGKTLEDSKRLSTEVRHERLAPT
jgi:hypothetical protein